MPQFLSTLNVNPRPLDSVGPHPSAPIPRAAPVHPTTRTPNTPPTADSPHYVQVSDEAAPPGAPRRSCGCGTRVGSLYDAGDLRLQGAVWCADTLSRQWTCGRGKDAGM